MKNDIAQRFPSNPLLKPSDLKPTISGMEIVCLLNPGAFRFQNKVWLIVRVAERPVQEKNFISFPILTEEGEMKIMQIKKDDPQLKATDARVINYKGEDYLTTLSHLRLICSEDGVHFHQPEEYSILFGSGKYEAFGIEDCRVSKIEDTFYLTYTAVSSNGVTVGLRTTKDWKVFKKEGIIFPPHNKDCAVFEEKINEKFYCFHRPSSPNIGGNYIWLAESENGKNWGNHQCILRTRTDKWDSERVGAGAAPIKTPHGWLEIFHGANEHNQYRLGALLLDLKDPSKVIARTDEPIMEPMRDYETKGFFGNVVFTNGHILHADGDTITVYYGAADEYVCAANFSLSQIFSRLK